MASLEGKSATVTGAGRGIGRQIALKLAGAGARVVVNDLDESEARGTVCDIRAAGGTAEVCAGSVTDEAFPQRLVDTAVEAFGGLDIIVNNAGYTWDTVIQKMTDDQWDAILDVHLKAPFRILRAAQPVFSAAVKRERESGQVPCRKVVNISSVSGTAGNAGQANYSSAKDGIVGLTKTLAKEWGRYNITVNAVAFGLITTRLTGAPDGSVIKVSGEDVSLGLDPAVAKAAERQIPLRRAGTPEDAAGAVYFFCSPESDYVSGQVLICNGGTG